MNISRKEQPIAWALIILGVLALLSSGGLLGTFLGGLSAAVRVSLLILGGVYLSRRYLRDPSEVWALVLALGLFGAALVAFSSGTAVLTLIGLGFSALYWRDKTPGGKRWWAVLPAGLFFSIALAVGFGGTLLGTAPLLFLGFAATFGYLMRLGKEWAVYPAIVALVIALLTTNVISGSLLPLLLIGGGVYLFANPKALSSKADTASFDAASPNVASSNVAPSSPLQSEPSQPVQNAEGIKEVDSEKSSEVQPEPAAPNAP